MTDGFTFRFQSILDLKERHERAMEIELGRLDADILECQEAIRAWERLRMEMLDRIRDARARSDMAENAQCSRYLSHVRREVEKGTRAAAQLRGQRESVRQELSRVVRERKVMETYRNRLKAEFLHAREKAEERVLDSHATWKFAGAEGAP